MNNLNNSDNNSLSQNNGSVKPLDKETQKSGKTAFSDLLRKFEKSYINQSIEYADLLQEAAAAITYSVLRKLDNTTCNKTVHELRNQLKHDLLISKSDKLFKDSYSNSIDLVHTAVAGLISEIEVASNHGVDTSKPGFLEVQYTKKVLNEKIRIQRSDNNSLFKEVATSIIQEIYRIIRREIASNSHPRIQSFTYAYISEKVNDSEGNEYTVYTRLLKYSDIISEVRDFNGKFVALTADNKSNDTIQSMIEKLELTDKQKQIVSLRLRGYGYKSISTYIGISEKSVRDRLKLVQKKAVEKLQLPSYLLDKCEVKKKLSDENKKVIHCMREEGHSLRFIGLKFNVSPSTILKIEKEKNEKEKNEKEKNEKEKNEKEKNEKEKNEKEKNEKE